MMGKKGVRMKKLYQIAMVTVILGVLLTGCGLGSQTKCGCGEPVPTPKASAEASTAIGRVFG